MNTHDNHTDELDFTGEFFIPGKAGNRIEADHFARYSFATNYAKGKSVLDIACGVGFAAPILIQAGASSYEGSDIQKNLVEYANKKYGKHGAEFFVSDITSLGISEKYDLITCFETIEHVRNYKSAISNLYKALKKGGILLISSPNRLITSPRCQHLSDKPSNEFHSQEFLPEELMIELKEAGFSTDRSRLYGQRQRPHFSNRLMHKLVKTFNPDLRASAEVTKIVWMEPRYFIVCATK